MKIPPEKLAPTIAMLVSFFVAGIEITVMSTVMPTIVGQLGGLPLYSWIFAAYLLTSTTTVPLYGKLADLYGRKPMFMLGTGLFLLGSLLCGLAMSMEQLIVFRAIQGLGAGGILSLTITIAGDLFPHEERAKMQGVMSAVWGVAALLGPLLGSLIVSQTTWRWVFWINLPIGLLAAGLLAATFHEDVAVRRHQIDFLGAALLTAGIAALLVALVEGGQAGFGAPSVLWLLAASAVLLALFAWVESRAAEPIVPFSLLRHRVLGLSSLGGFVLGACMYSASSYLPLYVQGAQGGTPQDVAWVSATVSVAWTGGSVAGSRVLLRLGFRPAALLGMGILSVGAALLLGLALDTPLPLVALAGVVLGLGMGVGSTTFIVVVQTAVGWEQRGVATALQQFFRAIGGTLWVSVQGAALSATAAAGLAAAGVALPGGVPARIGELNTLLEPAARGALPAEQARVLAEALGAGLHQVFLLYLAIALAGLAVVAFLPSGRMAQQTHAATGGAARLTNR